MLKVKCVAVFAAVAAVVAMCGWDARVGGAQKEKDKVVGAIWEYKATSGKGKKGEVVEEGQFRAHDFKIFKGGNQIGTYAQVGKNDYKVEITEGKLKGKFDLTATKNNTYRGEFESEKHGKCHIVVTLKKD